MPSPCLWSSAAGLTPLFTPEIQAALDDRVRQDDLEAAADRDLDADVVGPYYPAFFVDKQGRHPGEAVWVAGTTTTVGVMVRAVWLT